MPSVTFVSGQTLTAAELNQIGKDSDWQTMSTFTNSWAAGSRSVQYRKVGTRVTLTGIVQSGTANQNAFQLPTGYRPATNQLIPATNSVNGTNTVAIGSDGYVKPYLSQSTALDGISFYTD